MNASLLAVVSATHTPVAELVREGGLSSPFFNLFVEHLRLGPRPEDEAEELLARGRTCDRPFTAAELAWRLLAETGRQPNWLQVALRELIQRLDRERRREVTLEDVAWALDQVPRQVPGDFRDLWERVYPFPRQRESPQVLAAYQRVL